MEHTDNRKYTYHDKLKSLMDDYAHLVYRITRKFPKDEQYGVTSQLRRAALSVILNYVEGYGRGQNKVQKNFLTISFGSLKESKYLLHFSLVEGYLTKREYKESLNLADELGAMLWGILRKI